MSPVASAAPMSHRQVIQAMSGLLAGMFVAILSSTVVATSLPRIIGDLGGDQAAYTWVITATLLATTVSTPIWGKLADLMSRKMLVQVALGVFVLGSALAGLSQDPGTLIAFRVVQGLGAGGLTALVQVILSDIISPRERGRYMGFLGAVMAVGTAGGPLLGGIITDTIGWRWNFYVAVPFALLALILIQVTLHIPVHRRKVSIDYLGAALIAGGVSLLLIWVTLGGNQFEWGSATSILMIVGAVVVLALAVVVELRAAEPILPLALFRNRTFTLAVVASLSVGIALFGTSVFLSQYLQLARGKTPTESGLYTLPQVAGLLIASTVAGILISRTGKWKPWMVTGASLLTAGLFLMSMLRYDTPFLVVFVSMAVMGLGMGMLMQNIVLVVQNTVEVTQIGVASAGIAFFRSLGGAAGVAALGAVLAARVQDEIASGLAALGVPAGGPGGDGVIPDLAALPESVRLVIERAYGDAVGEVFLIAAPLGLVTLVMVALLPNVALGTRSGIQQRADLEADSVGEDIAEVLIEVSEDAVAAVVPSPDEIEQRADAAATDDRGERP